MKISGTFCAALTPLNKDFSINHEVYFEHCKRMLLHGSDGIAIFGSTGEANLLSLDSKMEAMQSLVDRGFNPSKLLPGTGMSSMNESIKLSNLAVKLQMAGALILPSYYYNNPADQGVIDYYTNIIESVNDEKFKILLYHIPQISGVPIKQNIIEALVKKYPDNIVGIKDSSNDLENMINTIKNFPDFCVFSGSDSLALPVMQGGGAGAITATANISVKLLSFIVKFAKNSDRSQELKKAHILQDSIRKIVFSQEQISFMKAIMRINTKDSIWENIMPPLVSLNDFNNNNNIKKIQELLIEMNDLSTNF
ncbi:MAG: 4-hydroxy-tetrahydrodipicolinate synthase [Alphaproteobacteria bacterium MarineAlpha5_Bin11]|nr:dihydrodipicolinate synthase family protein [Pelagibacteraceae bacterium]PPR42958.1 MAG: 4-hydroxy-tetrahydrodipicolinate synthase [Alphaproteobacteria bacterium MarineAlpha5_Bin11]PPR51550.1 MAG: 4-hydroxy-tetrahydrodipicolinate synthase [Alphaproteobacteria bacterium MarineAlpha5_Bin10]|tara:strand:+ start:9896 stop:10822 length:927 start_codon:yes stop_codon:yes gene_type:complete